MTPRPRRRGQARAPLRASLRAPVLATAACSLAVLTGCSGTSFSSGDQGFVGADGGDGIVTVIDEPSERPVPAGPVAGTTLDGEAVSLEDFRGKVVVMPVWGSWCAPCRAEAPMLAAAARDLADDGVAFLGIDARDENTDKARAFVEAADIGYPNVYDPDGRTLLAFHGTLPPMTIPSFVVIDAEGRIAARILDKAGASTLYGVVSDVLGRDLTVPEDVGA